MKNRSLLLLAILTFAWNSFLNSQTKVTDIDYSSLGFASYLTYVKSVSENYIIFQKAELARLDAKIKTERRDLEDATDATMKQQLQEAIEADSTQFAAKSAAFDTAQQKYASVKIAFDQILIQMMADMKAKNKIRLYKKLNRNLIDHQSIQNMNVSGRLTGRYVTQLKKADLLFKQIVNDYDAKMLPTPITDPSIKFAVEPGSVADLLGLVWTPIKDIHDMKAGKVESITTLLNDLRLTPLSELTSGGDSEEEEESEK